MTLRTMVIADPETADAFDLIWTEVMAFDLNDAMVDLDLTEVCARELLHRKTPTKLVARLVDQAIAEARRQRAEASVTS